MKKDTNFNHTLVACYFGMITQAVVNNFAPLLFLTFRREYGVSLERIALFVSLNFLTQLCVDLLAIPILPKLGYRRTAVGAHLFCALGLIGLAFLPDILPDPYIGLLISVMLYAVGGGMIEVFDSPMVEACPTEHKEAAMSLLHSFYCWGCALAILGSTLFFLAFGARAWRVLACLWALIPLVNALAFMRVPIRMPEDERPAGSTGSLFKNGLFWLIFVVILCGGAAEQSMSQWASAFAEAGLRVSKTAGDLAGPCAFAVLMGCARAWYAKNSEKLPVRRAMLLSALLCVASYLLASLTTSPAAGLAGCALCGLSVGVFWPGAISLAAKGIPDGGTRMFALLAFGGDIGCSLGPALVGLVSAAQGEDLHAGLLAAVVFPIILIAGLALAAAFTAKKSAKGD